MANVNTKEKSVLQIIIDLSEKLQGCKLEEAFLKEEKENLEHLANYLNVDETSAVFLQ